MKREGVMEVEKRTLKRKPLSDCTNIITSRSSSSLTKFRKPSLSTNQSDENSIKYDTSTGSNNSGNPKIQPPCSTPPRPQSSANSDTSHLEKSETVTVYSRRLTVEKRKNKGKAVALEIFSCPPAGRIRSIGDKLNKEHGGADLSTMCTVPRPKNKKKRHQSLPEQDVDKHALPQVFIDQQRAYFAEIDAFELLVEVVSEGELE